MGLDGLLFLLGLGFCGANVKALTDHVQYIRRRRTAVVVWPGTPPPFFQLQVGIGISLALLVLYNLAFRITPFGTLFGETMMLVYYLYAVPIGIRIERGFYTEGVWTDRGFMRYRSIGGISWREEANRITLLLASRGAGIARSLMVPGHLYGAVRRLLRDRIDANQIRLAGHPLDLGVKDDKEDA